MKLNKKLSSLYDLTDKKKSLQDFILSMLNRTLAMFQYDNLPDTLPAVELEKRLQVSGYATIFSYQGKLYVTTGGLTGQSDSPYNEPTKVIINVPSLKLNQTLTINKNCVLIKNDSLGVGLLPTLAKHGTLMLENDLTMLLSTYNARIQTLISAGDDSTINSARKYLSGIVDGNLGTIAENSFLQDLTVHNAQSQGKIEFQDLIAYQQYLKSDLYNDVGISSLNNMKKERLITSEVQSGQDEIFPLVDDMLANRQKGVEVMNKLFNGENVKVDFNGTWKDKADNRKTPNQNENNNNQVDNPQQVEQPKQQPQPKQDTQQSQPKQDTQQSQPKQEKQQSQPKQEKQSDK